MEFGDRRMAAMEMIRAMASGDKAALAALYERFSAKIFGLLLRIVRDQTAAEDLLQDVFWQAWRKSAEYSPLRGTPEVWLVLIARSRAIDHLRKKQPILSIQLETPHYNDPCDIASTREEVRSIRSALCRLPPEQQSAVHLAFFEGMTHEEIAAAQSVPLGTAKTRIRSAMRKLKEFLSATAESKVMVSS